ncbi:MAG TPA: hypothetical protein VLM11_16190 [Streptosporangiaceae bacterium]|nr:hypothetical protein [Streptosporangiaceae bacterium]
MSAPATLYSSTAPGAPKSHVSPGAKIPPNDSPKTRRPGPPTLTCPASLDSEPWDAASSHRPIPTWIHTAEAPACKG